MKISLAQINPIIGDLDGNTCKIISNIEAARNEGAQIVVFPELAICGYPPDDLLMLPQFIKAVGKKLEQIIEASSDIAVIVGVPRESSKGSEKPLFNSAAIIHNRKLIDYYDKILLPTYDIFDEKRYFEPGSLVKAVKIGELNIAITICEDIWHHSQLVTATAYHRDPIMDLKELKPDLLINLSASPYSFDKLSSRLHVCESAAKSLDCPVLLCNQVGGNDSLIFDGSSPYVGTKGLIKIAKSFSEELMTVDLKENSVIQPAWESLENLYSALVMGLKDYFHKSGFKKACLGLSGGIDSALVACIASDALGSENILGISMPSRYSSEGTKNDAKSLAANLEIDFKEISIESAFESYLSLLAPHFKGRPADSTEENLQARIRGMILMAFSNKFGYIVLSTGNKSELAIGYATLYGDMCGGLEVIGDVTKQQVYALCRWINRESERIPESIITREPSAELKENQKDSDSLPPYSIIDQVLKSYIEEHLSPEEIINRYGYQPTVVYDLIERIHRNEYKRRQSPPGLRVSEKAFSRGRHFPIVQKWVK